MPFFHLSFSFDPVDSMQEGSLKYLPLFALDEFFEIRKQKQLTDQNIDLFFLGANHSSRLVTLRSLKKICRSFGINCKFYVYLPFLMGLKGVLITGKLKPEEMMFKIISKNRLKKFLTKSSYVLDLPSPLQAGLTIRVFEALASGCKLITTNRHIRMEPFFDENYISVVDKENLHKIPEIISQNGIKNKSFDFENIR